MQVKQLKLALEQYGDNQLVYLELLPEDFSVQSDSSVESSLLDKELYIVRSISGDRYGVPVLGLRGEK